MTALKHPSAFTLERLSLGALSGAEQSSISAHVAGCAQCRARLEAMEQQAASFSRSSHSSPARQRVVRADQAWRRNAMRAVLLPAAAIVAVLAAAPWKDSTSVVDRPSPRQGRSPVELRPGTARPTLKTLSFRGQQVAFGQGTLEASEDEGASRPFVLEHTDVVAEVTGFISAVTVTQRFKNPFAKRVEAVYVFPLPENAAVDEMTLTAGTRVIRATIQKREEARRQYEQAKSQGRRAALLDQERPNIFTQSVANLLPGESVQVSLRYVAPLRFDDGAYTFNFPMVVGPRYMPGAPLAGDSQGTGTMPDTDRVDDASRISPPLERTGRDLSVEVRLETGAVIEELWSVSHQLQSERTSSSRAVITLDAADRVPNKDFILRWKVSGPETRAAVVSTGGPEGTFALMLNPEAQPSNEEVLPKEMVFVIDTSCSMNGQPLEAAKQAMALAMKQMNPRDSFMLIDFADRASSFHDSPLPNTPENVTKALGYLNALPSGGGTNQLDGIRRALDRPADGDRLRVVLLMTDGFIGNEQEIFQETQRLLGNGRVFGFGIGASVNHFLLARLSEEGRGFYQYVRTDEDPTEAVSRFVRRIAKPLMTDVTIDWGGLQVVDVLPRKVPDLFDAQPVVLLGRYRNGGPATITLRGHVGAKNVELATRVNLGVASAASSGLTSMWARARIEEVDRLQKFGQFPEAVKEITTLGLEHHLVTAYTSFVAVDSMPVTDGESTQVVVPTETEEQRGPPLHAYRYNTIQVIRGSAEPEPPPAPPTTIPLVTPPRPDPTTPERLHGESGGGDRFDNLFGDSKKDEGRFNPDPAPTNQTKRSLDQADILEGVLTARSQWQACIAEQHTLQPSVTNGKVVMKWTIGTDGRVKSVSVVPGEFANSPFAACLKRVIWKLQFPLHSVAGEPVQFPFKF
ncbi:MAG: VIT domain-containing protein [Myxococcaceae bacterium]